MAAQLTVRKHSSHHRVGAVHVSACVVWMLNDNKKKKSSLENGVFESFPSRKIKWSESERGRGDREREKR